MLRAQNISVARGGLTLLSDLNFTVDPGQILVVRGANGIGKTSLLRCLVGLQPIAGGDLHLDVDPVYAAHLDGIKPSLSVRENLKFWSQIFDNGDVDDVLARLHLLGLADRSGAHLSAGQKRRLGLARVLISGCKLWVLDEPTAALDHRNSSLFLDILSDHVAGGGAAVLSSHLDINLKTTPLDLQPFVAKADHILGPFSEALE